MNKDKLKQLLLSLASFNTNNKPQFIEHDPMIEIVNAKCKYCNIIGGNSLANNRMTCSNCYKTTDFDLNAQCENIENIIKEMI